MALTNTEQNWLTGFISFFEGAKRPASPGPKQRGWDAAEKCSLHGGY